jgi:hypothetical protein
MPLKKIPKGHLRARFSKKGVEILPQTRLKASEIPCAMGPRQRLHVKLHIRDNHNFNPSVF